MKDVQVTINPTEVRQVNYLNNFNKKPGEKIALSIRSEVAVKPNPTNPVSAVVMVKTHVEDPDKCINFEAETITGVTLSTFVDDIEGFIRANYLPIIITASNERIRDISSLMGTPIRFPSPQFGRKPQEEAGTLTN